MGRKRQYNSALERLRAFRARSKEKAETPPASPQPKRKSKTSRPAKLMAIENETRALLEDYQAWWDCLPESLREGVMAAKLEEAIERLTEVTEILASVDLPKGFGRD